MKDSLAEVRALLTAWARFLDTPSGGQVGGFTPPIYTHPLKNTGKLDAWGKPTPATPGQRVYIPSGVDEVDHLVGELQHWNFDLWLVIHAEYRSVVLAFDEKGRMGWRRVRFDPRAGCQDHQSRVAAGLGVSVATYRNRLENALHRLDATLAERRRMRAQTPAA